MRKPPSVIRDLDEDQTLWQQVTKRITPLQSRSQSTSSTTLVKKQARSTKPAPKISKKSTVGSSTKILKPLLPIDLQRGDRADLMAEHNEDCLVVMFRLTAALICMVIRLLALKLNCKDLLKTPTMQDVVVYW